MPWNLPSSERAGEFQAVTDPRAPVCPTRKARLGVVPCWGGAVFRLADPLLAGEVDISECPALSDTLGHAAAVADRNTTADFRADFIPGVTVGRAGPGCGMRVGVWCRVVGNLLLASASASAPGGGFVALSCGSRARFYPPLPIGRRKHFVGSLAKPRPVGDDAAHAQWLIMAVVTAITAVLAGCAPPMTSRLAAPRPARSRHCPALKAGRLTFGTDQPAYPPWFVDNNPANGRVSSRPSRTRSRKTRIPAGGRAVGQRSVQRGDRAGPQRPSTPT